MRIPPVRLLAEDGSELDLTDAVREKPAVIVFFRGSW
jgi:hypothetical protein